MRISVNQQNLAKALSIAGRAVSSRTTMPVLSNILLEAKNNQLRLAATNREIGINCWIGAKVEVEGAITIPARLLSEFVNSLPPERIDMELAVRTQTLHLSCARFEANMKGIDAYEFPALPTMAAIINPPDGGDSGYSGVQVALDTTVLGEMIGQVIFAASTDENRPTLTGVEVTLASDRLQMAATDGYRLSVRGATIEGGPPEQQVVIVPAKTLATLSDVVDGGATVDVLLTPRRNQIMFAADGKPAKSGETLVQRVELVSELIDARYPDYRATIPKTHTTRTIVDTAALLKAVRVALLFARDNANTVRLYIDDDQLRLVGTSAEMGDQVGDIAADVEGPQLEIAMNARYVIDVLSQVTTPQVALETTMPTRPMAVKPVGQDEYLHVIMPKHL